jgi:hypothetical protein
LQDRPPAEIKYCGTHGVRLIAQTAGRHTLADVVSDVAEFLDRLRAELGVQAQDAA